MCFRDLAGDSLYHHRPAFCNDAALGGLAWMSETGLSSRGLPSPSKARSSHNRIHRGEIISSSSVRVRRVLPHTAQDRALRDGHGPESCQKWPSMSSLDAIFNPELASHPGKTLNFGSRSRSPSCTWNARAVSRHMPGGFRKTLGVSERRSTGGGRWPFLL